ncbi:response regulator transcription factor [Geomobilimonas luticola]|jgi:twitching motility two-component system response regulator PilG|uniref:Response regulator n=1 Tax=Geomobilimonas luticola TaxID=1114878 RepID=A0ABS5SFP2_9BACT|nr:response regulator [Geomobilimonas luticola]MBT0654176.1 response regulator [Geomobilimonas luticola]HEX5773336.1 response regulator [Geomobilimonas sp.]
MHKNKILVVEDEESLLKLESILLSSKGYNVTGVMDGRSALEEIAANPPDLVILDIMLPELDGFEVCRHIKEDPATKGIPVVMLTAKKNSQDYARGMEMGADAYITKPFKSAKVIETIEGLLNK